MKLALTAVCVIAFSSAPAFAQTFVAQTSETARFQGEKKIEGVLWDCKAKTCRTAVNSAVIVTVDHCRKLAAEAGVITSYTRGPPSNSVVLNAAALAQCNSPAPPAPMVVPGVKLPPGAIQPALPPQARPQLSSPPAPTAKPQAPPEPKPQATPTPEPASGTTTKPADTSGFSFRAPLLTISGAPTAATTAGFKPQAFRTPTLTISGTTPAPLPPFAPKVFRTPTLTISGAGK